MERPSNRTPYPEYLLVMARVNLDEVEGAGHNGRGPRSEAPSLLLPDVYDCLIS